MGRLTKEFEFGLGYTECYEACGMCFTVESGSFCTGLQEMLEKLAHYEDLEEQGRLIELPFKLGTKIYRAYYDEVDEWEMTEWNAMLVVKEFGKTVFLTKEEAEAKLQKLKEGVE